MPHEVDIEYPPAGYSVESARAGEDVKVETQGLYTTEDGKELLTRLEGMPSILLSKITPTIPPSQIDHILAIFRPDGTATVYVNELTIIAKVRAGASEFRAGQLVRPDDIVEVHSLDLGVQVPHNCSVLFLTSVGWRKALYFDFTATPDSPRVFDLARVFGQVHSYLVFQERLRITDEEWDRLFASEWFPFIGLPMKMVLNMLACIRANWNPDELTDSIVAELRRSIPGWLVSWRSHAALHGHLVVLERAANHFLNEDYVSSTALLYPRIEGVLRGAAGADKSQEGLSRSAAQEDDFSAYKPMLPSRFRRYVREVYFRSFDPAASEHGVSRNTVGHGIASEDAFNKKAACLGLLIVQQLFFSLRRPQAGAQ